MPNATKAELTAAARWFNQPILTTAPHWVAESRVILRQRAKGRSLRRIMRLLDRLENKTHGHGHNQQTVNRRLAWAIELYRGYHKPSL